MCAKNYGLVLNPNFFKKDNRLLTILDFGQLWDSFGARMVKCMYERSGDMGIYQNSLNFEWLVLRARTKLEARTGHFEKL